MTEARLFADRLVKAAPLAQRAMKEVAIRAQRLPMLEAIRFGETMRKVVADTEGRDGGGTRRSRGSAARVERPLTGQR